MDEQAYFDLAEKTLFDSGVEDQKRSLNQFKMNYRAERAGDLPPFDSFVRALAPVAYDYVGSSSPSDFFTYLGRLGGISYPRLGGAGDKYFRPAPQFLDMMVASVIRPKEEIVIGQFWNRVWERYGIICGGRRDRDADVLQHVGMASLSAAGLASNSSGLNAQLERMGYLKRFADGVALVSSGVN